VQHHIFVIEQVKVGQFVNDNLAASKSARRRINDLSSAKSEISA
jgi:hypothetical protein